MTQKCLHKRIKNIQPRRRETKTRTKYIYKKKITQNHLISYNEWQTNSVIINYFISFYFFLFKYPYLLLLILFFIFSLDERISVWKRGTNWNKFNSKIWQCLVLYEFKFHEEKKIEKKKKIFKKWWTKKNKIVNL